MSRPVKLHVYDLSNGLARQLSASLLGKQIDGIWHTGVVVDGREYFFGQGIQHCPAAQSPFGAPLQVIPLGDTEIPKEMIHDFLADVHERFNAQTYNLLTNNCNNFSNEMATFLVGKGIPEHITGLPAEVAATPFGQMIIPMLQPALEQRFGNATATRFEPASTVPGSHPTHAAEPPLGSAAATPPVTDAAAAAHVHTAHEAQLASSREVREVVDELKHAHAGSEHAASARRAFQTALSEEFVRVQQEGELDVNKAGAEAMRRVMVAVKDGLVQPPEEPASTTVQA